jgi:hypothetical protein
MEHNVFRQKCVGYFHGQIRLTLSHLPITRYDEIRQAFLGFFPTTGEHGLFQRKSAEEITQVSTARANAPPLWGSARISAYQRFNPSRLCPFASKEFTAQLL